MKELLSQIRRLIAPLRSLSCQLPMQGEEGEEAAKLVNAVIDAEGALFRLQDAQPTEPPATSPALFNLPPPLPPSPLPSPQITRKGSSREHDFLNWHEIERFLLLNSALYRATIEQSNHLGLSPHDTDRLLIARLAEALLGAQRQANFAALTAPQPRNIGY